MTALTGTWALVRFALRRDRIRLLIWVVSLSVLAGISADSVLGFYPTREALQTYARAVSGNTAIIAFSGPDRALGTPGGRIAFEIWQYCVAVALMAVFAVTRGLRAEEESGRAELVRATVVGRHAHSASALIVAAGASLAVGIGTAGALIGQGLPTRGSLVLGAAFAVIGVSFAAVALVTNQLTGHARTASGMAGAVMGVTYVFRIIGDTSIPAFRWLSPFGWAQAMWPFSGDRWWPFGLALLAVGALTALALALERRRDHGAGMVTPRAGPAEAPAWLGTQMGIAWRLQRGAVLSWAIGATLLASIMGPLINDAEKIIGDNEELRNYLAAIGGASVADLYLGALLGYMALAAAGFAVQSVMRLRSEETAGRADLVLTTGTSRWWWAGANLIVLMGGVLLILIGSAGAMGLTYGAEISDPGQVPRVIGAALLYVPAVGVIAALALLAFGLRGRLAVIGWLVFSFCVVELILGQLLQWSERVRNLSPLHHLAGVPADPPGAATIGWLLAIAVGAGLAGLVAFRRRDVG